MSDELDTRTFTVDYAGGNASAFDALQEEVVELFESFGFTVDGCSDGPTADFYAGRPSVPSSPSRGGSVR